uniref:Uncharacterized protein n=1 Tax=Anguilla anguilla TaxID=7936 RepID=A0A0E9SLV9_ANGAN
MICFTVNRNHVEIMLFSPHVATFGKGETDIRNYFAYETQD